ncbi:hypothetical protein [Acinetobacter larvae]|nr:hypothetical protein [Acinetobacter larvae]
MLSLLALGYFMTQLNLYFTIALLCLWGGAAAILFIALQSYVIKTAQQHAQGAVAIYVAIFNASIGLGALGSAQLLRYLPFNHILQLLALGSILGLYCIRKAEQAHSVANHAISHRTD